MRTVAGLLMIWLVVAALRAAVVALVVAMIIALLWSLITQPRETIVFLATCAGACAVVAHPLACIIAFCVIGVAAIVASARQKAAADARQRSQRPLLLTDGREQP